MTVARKRKSVLFIIWTSLSLNDLCKYFSGTTNFISTFGSTFEHVIGPVGGRDIHGFQEFHIIINIEFRDKSNTSIVSIRYVTNDISRWFVPS